MTAFWIRRILESYREKHILLIEDSVHDKDLFIHEIRDLAVSVEWRADAMEGLAAAMEGDFDLVVCDLKLPTMSGLRVAAEIKLAKPNQRVVIYTGQTHDPEFMAAVDSDITVMEKGNASAAQVVSAMINVPIIPRSMAHATDFCLDRSVQGCLA